MTWITVLQYLVILVLTFGVFTNFTKRWRAASGLSCLATIMQASVIYIRAGGEELTGATLGLTVAATLCVGFGLAFMARREWSRAASGWNLAILLLIVATFFV